MHLEALHGASKNAQKAVDALRSPEFSTVPQDEKEAWAMAALIHLDMTRLIAALQECREPFARLLWMADAISKLFEAKQWYAQKGSPLLLKIANRRKCRSEPIQARLRTLNQEYRLNRVDRYGDYRNKFSYHYDRTALGFLARFEQEDAEEFFGLLASFARFSGDWALLTRQLLRDELEQEKA